MKKFLAIFIAKTTIFFIKLLKRGRGSALPGLLALKIDKNILTELTKNLKYGNVIITGTNGKTTTAKFLTDILRNTGMDVITNESGSNLSRGLVSTLIMRSNITGKKTKGDVGIFEIDEATMREAVPMLEPNIIAVTNLFRDQLDRYGELDKTAELIGNSLSYAPKANIILNADDPLVTSLAAYNKNATFYGIEDPSLNDPTEFDNDNKDCVSCGHLLQYELRYFSHMGIYKCPKCKLERPEPENLVKKVIPHKEFTEFFYSPVKESDISITLNVAGIYNVYNALAAASIAKALKINERQIKYGLEQSSAAFGRMEKIQVKDKFVYILLVKNPTGLTESIKSIISDKEKINILLALNDNFADGTDVSWIWDSEIEILENKTNEIIVTGIRALDLRLRFKYAEVGKNIILEKNVIKALEKGIENMASGETLYVLPTYTAMLEIRKVLVKMGYAKEFKV